MQGTGEVKHWRTHRPDQTIQSRVSYKVDLTSKIINSVVQWNNILLFLSPSYRHRQVRDTWLVKSRGCTCFGEVSQGAAEGAPLQALSHGVGVVQTGAVHASIPGLLLQAGALRHAGPHHPLLLLQLSCGEESQGKTEVSGGGFNIAPGPGNFSVMPSATFFYTVWNSLLIFIISNILLSYVLTELPFKCPENKCASHPVNSCKNSPSLSATAE